MLVTEERAKTKWCPFVRGLLANIDPEDTHTVLPDSVAFNRVIPPADVNGGCACVGSQCMAWQWAFITKPLPKPGSPKIGYCGLAGKE